MGIEPDLVRSGEGDLISLRSRIMQVGVPDKDPVYGGEGPCSGSGSAIRMASKARFSHHFRGAKVCGDRKGSL
jgi:hypothetical protein